MRIVGGKYKGRVLTAPKGDGTRPTTDRTRESLFNILSNTIDFNGLRVLDLFSGTGALGLEALSRGAASVVFVEKANAALAALKRNVDALAITEATQIVRGDATTLRSLETDKPFDLVFADPPYGKGLGERSAINLANGNYLKSEALFVLEESSDAIPEKLQYYERIDMRKYGNSSIGLFRFLGRNIDIS